MLFAEQFLTEAGQIARTLNINAIENAVRVLAATRANGGRLFILGIGGGAGNATHAVNDFRKLCGIETYAPTDNVSELTARTNDEGWPSVFVEWLKISRLKANDCLLVMSVGGGDVARNVSANIVAALEYAKSVDAKIVGLVGRDGGYTAKVANACVLIPSVNPGHITPHTEAFQALIWHLFVTHPGLKVATTKWESVPNRD